MIRLKKKNRQHKTHPAQGIETQDYLGMKKFCRGYQRSLNCGFTFYHPMRAKMEAQGQRIIEKGAPDGVVVYRGFLKEIESLLVEKFNLMVIRREAECCLVRILIQMNFT